MRDHLIAFIESAKQEFADERHRGVTISLTADYMEYRLSFGGERATVDYWDSKFGDRLPEEMEVEAAVDRMLAESKRGDL